MNALVSNPYAALIDSFVAPHAEEVIAGCSTLIAFGQHRPLGDPGEIALAEYRFFTQQTYLFELVGLQLLGEMMAKLRSQATLRALAEQAVDEVRHVEAYRCLLRKLGGDDLVGDAELPARMHRAFVLNGSFEEKLVRAFVVLESLALGLFSARAHYFRHTAVCRIDRRILLEESQHQSQGLSLIAELVRDGALTLAQVSEATRCAVSELGSVLSPAPLLAACGLRADRAEVESVLQSGVLGAQRQITRRCISRSLRRLRRELQGRDREELN